MRHLKVFSLAVSLLLVASALLMRVWVSGATRETQAASDLMVAATQKAMMQSSELDLAVGSREGSPALHKLLAEAAGPQYRAALQVLVQCLEDKCGEEQRYVLEAKVALSAPLKRQREQLLVATETEQARETAFLVGLCLLAIGSLMLTFAIGVRTQALEVGPEPAELPLPEAEEEADIALAKTLQERLEQLYAARTQARQNSRFAAFGEVAAGLSHGLKTPLACVRAATQVAQAKIEDEHPAQSNLDDVLDEVDGLVDQINRFLKTMGSGTPEFETLEASEVLAGIDKRYRQGEVARKVGWNMSIAQDVPAIRGTTELIEMALRNLIDNAFQASGEGAEVRLCVDTCRAPERVGIDAERPPKEFGSVAWVEIAVLDSGKGIALLDVSKENVESSRADGSGLGISIARRIAARLGGALILAPRSDAQGTRASFVLPPASCDTADSEGMADTHDLHS